MTDRDDLPIVAIGERHLVEGFALGGARVIGAEHPPEVERAWQDLPQEAIVILTTAAARAVEAVEADPTTRRLRVVMPE